MKANKTVSSSNIKSSLKTTSLFGGVQIIGIVVSIIRNKFVALLIGPLGVGIVELYNSTIRLIKSLTDFSIQISAVRDVSIAYKSGDSTIFNHVTTLFSKIVWFTGILGAGICFLGSPLWSRLTFGNFNYTLGFALLSSVLLFNQLQSGKGVLLQSTGHYRYLALSGIIGNVMGLLTTVPIYYMMGIDGIVAVLIITAATAYILTYYYASKIKMQKTNLSIRQAIIEGRNMLGQGYLLSINFLFSSLIFYILRIFITDKGGVEELGLYSASFAIINTYLNLIFQSMTQEYYPRISGLCSEISKFNDAVNSQIYLILLILGPLIAIFLTFSDKLLIILYSHQFSDAGLLMALSMVGVILQAPSVCMGYAFLAKGDNKAFFLYESIAKIQKLVTDILFYLLWGLAGLGWSLIVSYTYYTVQCVFVCKKRYNLSLSGLVYKIIVFYLLLGGLLVGVFYYYSFVLRTVIGSFFIIVSSFYSYYQLDKIVGLKSYVQRKLFKNTNE